MAAEFTSDIVKRLDRLERQNRRLRWLLLLLPAVALAIGAGANTDPLKAKSVVAEQFILNDADGKHRGSLMMVDGSAVLTLRDAEGNNRVTLQAGDDGIDSKKKGPGLFLVSGKGKAVATLYHYNGLSSSLSLASADGTGHTSLQSGSDSNGPGLFMATTKGQNVVTLHHVNGEASLLTLSSSEGKQLVSAGLNKQTGGGSVSLMDRDGKFSNAIDVKSEK
ncbi:MAG: hypothetical protein WEB58_04325 [Planctomycetaceae bacterium]